MTMIHAGLIPAILVFLLWRLVLLLHYSRCVTATKRNLTSLPGAIGMFGLSLGVQKISDVLPGVAYALLSGLNAATVGLVALAAVQVSEYSTHFNSHNMLT